MPTQATIAKLNADETLKSKFLKDIGQVFEKHGLEISSEFKDLLKSPARGRIQPLESTVAITITN